MYFFVFIVFFMVFWHIGHLLFCVFLGFVVVYFGVCVFGCLFPYSFLVFLWGLLFFWVFWCLYVYIYAGSYLLFSPIFSPTMVF